MLEYLGRYTQRVAIDNRRILNVSDGKVTFQYKQYRATDAHKSRTMTVEADEFIRRFLLHALPPGLPRIRHYGLFAGRTKKQNLALCRNLLSVSADSPLPSALEVQASVSPVEDPSRRCPRCQVGRMFRAFVIIPCANNTS